MARFSAQKPTPDDALEEMRTGDFVRFFSQTPSYDDQAFESEEQLDEPDDDLYTSDDRSWLHKQFSDNTTNKPHKDGYIY